MLTFAFGMNTDPGTMHWCGALNPRAATLPDWKLEFRGLANVVPSPGDVVHGVVWELDEKGLRDIDGREGFRGDGNPFNLYDRQTVTCQTDEGAVEALIYTMSRRTLGLDDGWSSHKLVAPPGYGYLAYLVNGYTHFGLPADALWDSVRNSCKDADEFERLSESWKEYARYA